MLTPNEVAKLHPHLGTARTLQRWARSKLVEHHRTPGGHIRFTSEQVDALLEKVPKREYRPEVLAPNPDFRRMDPAPKLTLVGAKRKRRGAA